LFSFVFVHLVSVSLRTSLLSIVALELLLVERIFCSHFVFRSCSYVFCNVDLAETIFVRRLTEKNARFSLLFRKKPRRVNEAHETFLNNTVKYRKNLQATLIQINRTKKSVQRTLDQPDSDIHSKFLLRMSKLIFDLI